MLTKFKYYCTYHDLEYSSKIENLADINIFDNKFRYEQHGAFRRKTGNKVYCFYKFKNKSKARSI